MSAAAICSALGLIGDVSTETAAAAAYFGGKVDTQDVAMVTFMGRIGVLDSAKQREVRARVVDDELLAKIASTDGALAASGGPFLGGAAAPTADDATLLTALLPIFNSVISQTDRARFPNVAAWCDACFATPAFSKVLGEHASHYAGQQRVGDQVDVFADSRQVRQLADACRALNAGHVKKKTQRQLEADMKNSGGATGAGAANASATPTAAPAAAPAAPTTAAPFALGDTVPAEASTDDKIAAMTAKLDKLSISYKVVKHARAMDMVQLNEALAAESGIKCKNLFLKAKKPRDPNDSRMWLVCAPGETQVNLKALQSALKYPSKGELRFGAAPDLLDALQCVQGDVTPLALTNDPACKVNVVLDSAMLANPETKIWFHPLTNEASVAISPADLRKWLQASGRVHVELDLGSLGK